MLEDKSGLRLFSYYTSNVYAISNIISRKSQEITYKIDNVIDNEKTEYILKYLEFYHNPNVYYKNEWLNSNFSKCFGGRLIDETFIWPCDYISERASLENPSSIGLIFFEQQFKSLIPASKILNAKNVIQLVLPLFEAIKLLHKKGIALSGISLSQLWYNSISHTLHIQALYNCIDITIEGTFSEIHVTDAAKYLYHEKAFALPLGSIWDSLPLNLYSINSDIYALATILFWGLFGRHPLDGRLCDDQGDEEGKSIIYNNEPCFIFDQDDRSNAIGEFESEEGILKKWDILDKELKCLFWELYSFPKDSTSFTIPIKKNVMLSCFQIDEWIRILKKMAEGTVND